MSVLGKGIQRLVKTINNPALDSNLPSACRDYLTSTFLTEKLKKGWAVPPMSVPMGYKNYTL